MTLRLLLLIPKALSSRIQWDLKAELRSYLDVYQLGAFSVAYFASIAHVSLQWSGLCYYLPMLSTFFYFTLFRIAFYQVGLVWNGSKKERHTVYGLFICNESCSLISQYGDVLTNNSRFACLEPLITWY